MAPQHAAESAAVLINRQTPIREADGTVWVSRVPAVSFFIPGQWFNVVALLEEGGVRYYCNAASPPYLSDDTLTYIDYDLDVIRAADGEVAVVDEDEYQRHKALYRYSGLVEGKVEQGMKSLLARIESGGAPFQDEWVRNYYELWDRQSEPDEDEVDT